jgi:hypothetical protein
MSNLKTASNRIGWLAFLCGMGLCLMARGGAWVTNSSPGPIGVALLLSNGEVLAQRGPGYSNWFRLPPDSQGHYFDSQWTSNSGLSMLNNRQFFSSDVLPDGRVFVAGGEYGDLGSGNRAEVYDPVSNQWTQVSVPFGVLQTNLVANDGLNAGFRDSPSIVLADGTVLIAPIFSFYSQETVIYDAKANTWSTVPAYLGASLNEVSWVKLPDQSILTIDKNSTTTERYIPALRSWIQDRNVPVTMYSTNAEIGAGLLLPTGKVVFFGGTGNTVFYTPSGTTDPGTWSQATNIPAGLVARDAPAAVLPNGNVLCAFSPTSSDKPISFYEFDPVQNIYTPVTSPDGNATYNRDISDQTAMLVLPDGNVLFTDAKNTSVYIYQPSGGPAPAWKPVIMSISYNGDGSLHVRGTQLNGLSQGAAFGDDAQMDSNYPLVRFTDSSGNVYYGRTYNWSSTGVQTASQIVSTECVLPSNVLAGPGAYTIQVVANGIASDPIGFPGPIWVDFNYTGHPQLGTYDDPFGTMAQGVTAVAVGASILLKPGTSHETMTISKPMSITSVNGTDIIGR